MFKSTRFSIIIPVYNTEKYLVQCLDSIINQNYENYELLLIHDESDDKSGEICDTYAAEYSNITVIHRDKDHTSTARNIGLDLAKGEYIVFVDSDDWLAENCLCILDEAIQKYNKPDVIQGDYWYSKNRLIFKKPFKVNTWWIDTKEDLEKIRLAGFSYINSITYTSLRPVWGKAYKRSVISTIRFKEIRSEDSLFNLEVLESCESFLYLSKGLYYQRQNIISWRSRYCPNRIDEEIESCELRKEYLFKYNKPPVFFDGLILYAREMLGQIIRNIMHPQNKCSYLEKRHQIAELFQMPYFSQAIKTNNKKFSRNNKILVFLLRHKLYDVVMIATCFLGGDS